MDFRDSAPPSPCIVLNLLQEPASRLPLTGGVIGILLVDIITFRFICLTEIIMPWYFSRRTIRLALSMEIGLFNMDNNISITSEIPVILIILFAGSGREIAVKDLTPLPLPFPLQISRIERGTSAF